MNKKTVFLGSALALSVVLGIAFRLSEDFAEFYTLNIAKFFRIPLSFISSLFPFSLAESVILILVLLSAVTLVSGLKLLVAKLFSKSVSSHFKLYSRTVLYSLLFIFFTYAFVFQSSYSRTPINEHLGLEEKEMTAENISEAMKVVSHELNELSGEIAYSEEIGTFSEMTFPEMSREVLSSAKKASEKYSFYQGLPFKAKSIAFSVPMAYTGISGVYTFFTGEANINTEFSTYSLPFTIAHEYSHQLGIGSEMQAEFSALLICLESENSYVRYSAYSQVAITLLNTLFELDENAFYEAFSDIPHCLVNDIYLSSRSSQKYSETYADEIAKTINNTYLTLSGDEGVVSYSLSSRLYVAYFLRSK